MSITKNIVNIQNNRLDYSLNGTNSLRYIFRGTEHFRLTEVGGTSVCQFIAQKALDDGNFTVSAGSTNADFIGRVSNINNHSIENLNDVAFTNLSNGDSLIYNGTNFVNGPGGVGSITIEGDDGESTLSFSTNFRILGTNNEINTQVSSNLVTISLPSALIAPGSLAVTGPLTANSSSVLGGDVVINGNLTVNGNQTIINTEIKLIEDPLIELGYSASSLGEEIHDIGFFGQYRADNYAGLYYDASSTSFRIFDTLGSSAYAASLGTNSTAQTVPTNTNAASIIAKNFETFRGSFGETIFTDSRSFTTNTASANIVVISLKNTLSNFYGSNTKGIFSGKLIAYSYTNNFDNSSVTLLNYVYLAYQDGSTTVSKATYTVEIEDKTPNYAYTNFSYIEGAFSSLITINTNDAPSMTEGTTFFTIAKILPIISAN